MKLSTALLIIVLLFHISCKKEKSCENCGQIPEPPTPAGGNRPPIANAGPDLNIIMPIDSATLDGSASRDPEGSITAYQWTRITGPSLFNFSNATLANTVARNLVAGVYEVELKVTDNAGLSAKDTMQITVSPAPVTATGCNFSMDIVGHLPSPGMVGYIVSARTKILFTHYDGTVDVYDTLTQNWQSTGGLFAAANYGKYSKAEAAVIDNKVVFYTPEGEYGPAPDQVVNIYDALTNSWSTTHLPRYRDFYSMVRVGDKAIYSGNGGGGPDSTVPQKIEIYNASSNAWSVVNFNEGRKGMVAASIGNKVLFAGGFVNRYDSLVQQCDDYGNNCQMVPALTALNRVDIWDVAANTWSVAQLSEARCNMVTAVVGNKVLFIGGEKFDINHSSQVDIYDASNNTWKSHTLDYSSWFGPSLAYTVGNKVLVCNWITNRIDIYDAISDSWSTHFMPDILIGEAHQNGMVAVAGNKAVFYLQYNRDEANSRNVDIYDATTNNWCHSQINQPMLRQGIAAVGNRIYVAGGLTSAGNGSFNNLLDNLWILNY